VGRDWTIEELDAAVEKGPHISALEPDAIKQIHVEAIEKAQQGFATIHKWKNLRQNLPAALKLSPLAMIPHKSRRYRAILDLSFRLRMNGYDVPSVNEATKICAPEDAINQIGSVLPRIIEALAETADDPNRRIIRQNRHQRWILEDGVPNRPGVELRLRPPQPTGRRG